MLPKEESKPVSKAPRNPRKKHPFVFHEDPEWVETVRLFKEFITDINQSISECQILKGNPQLFSREEKKTPVAPISTAAQKSPSGATGSQPREPSLVRANSNGKGGNSSRQTCGLPTMVADKKQKKESVMNNYSVLFSYSVNQQQTPLQNSKPH